MGFKAVLGQDELFTDRNTRDNLAWTIGNGADLRGIPHRIPRAWDSKGEAKGKSRHKNNNKSVLKNLEERNVGRKRRSP